MITQKIELHEEPKAFQYQVNQGGTYYKYIQQKNSFTSTEIELYRQRAHELGMVAGVKLKHKLTDHKVIIIGFNDNHNITGYKGNPAILHCQRHSENYYWETNFTLEELLSPNFEILSKECLEDGCT